MALTPEEVKPHLDIMTEAIEALSRLPSPLAGLAQAGKRGSLLLRKLVGESRNEG